MQSRYHFSSRPKNYQSTNHIPIPIANISLPAAVDVVLHTTFLIVETCSHILHMQCSGKTSSRGWALNRISVKTSIAAIDVTMSTPPWNEDKWEGGKNNGMMLAMVQSNGSRTHDQT